MEFHPLPNGKPAEAAHVNGVDAKPWLKHPGLPSRANQKFQCLSREQVEQFDRDGFIALKAADVWTPSELKLLLDSVEQLQILPDKPGH